MWAVANVSSIKTVIIRFFIFFFCLDFIFPPQSTQTPFGHALFRQILLTRLETLFQLVEQLAQRVQFGRTEKSDGQFESIKR